MSKSHDSDHDQLAEAVASALSKENLKSFETLVALARDAWFETKQKNSAIDAIAEHVIDEELAK